MSATILEILRHRARTGESRHGKQWAQGVLFAANQVERFGVKRSTGSLVSTEENPSKPDNELVWGGVANAGRNSRSRQPRWSHVCSALGVGSNFSIELCKRMGFDPHEQIGGDDEGDYEGEEG